MPPSMTKVYLQKSTPEHFELTTSDYTAPKDFALTHTLFWPQRGSTSTEEVHASLKEGLSRLVRDVPQLCGTLQRGSSDPRQLFLEIDVSAHVAFEFQNLSNNHGLPSYDEFERDHFPISEVHSVFQPAILQQPVLEGSPMMGAKMCVIKGGYTLAFGFNHVFADGTSASELESLWARHTVDASAGESFVSHREYERGVDEAIKKRLSSPQSGAEKLGQNDQLWRTVPASQSMTSLHTSIGSVLESVVGMMDRKEAYSASRAETPVVKKWHLWRFRPQSLKSLKADSTSPGSDGWVSTSNALIGLFWSRIAAIQKFSSTGQRTSTVLMPISMRQRFDPPIATTFIGNAVSMAFANCTLAALEATDGISALQSAALSLRKAVQTWSLSEFDAFLNTFQSLPPDQGMMVRSELVFDKHRIVCNDCTHFKSNRLDWGRHLGVPAPTRFPMPAALIFGATSIVVHPKLPDGSLEVVVSLSEADGKALREDETFLRYSPDLLCVLPAGKPFRVTPLLRSSVRMLLIYERLRRRVIWKWGAVVLIAAASLFIMGRRGLGNS